MPGGDDPRVFDASLDMTCRGSLRWIMAARQRSRVIAIALIVLTFFGTSGAWHAADDDDVASAPVAHDHSRHHETVRVPPARSATEHCALCHWLQAFRADGARAPRAFLAASASHAPSLTAVQPLRAAFRLDLPSRAPPA
jgi:hypothetical protein